MSGGPIDALLALRPAWASEREVVEAEIASLLAVARAALPDLGAVTDEGFVAWLAERLPEGSPADVLAGIHPDDLLLACGCARGLPEAVRAFEQRYADALHAAARRVQSDREFIDEVVQRVRVKLLVGDNGPPAIASYLGRGPLRAWVQVTTTRLALTLRRSEGRRREDRDDGLTDALPDVIQPELAHIRDAYRAQFEEAFRDSLASLTARERNVLRHYLLEGLNIDRIGKMYGAHRATVARWIAAARDKLLDETRRTLVARLRIGPSELDSLMGLVQSQLDLSIASFLRKE